TVCLTRAIAETGSVLKFGKDIVVDKHCVGGVPGNRTTMIIVPIMAALGYTMPKISSRAITSPAGTADTMEVLAPVTFSSSEIKRIVDKVGACIAWGGGSDIASADDKMIRVRRPLSLDPEPLLLSSILAKKYAMGATHLIIDIPVAQDAKTRDIGEARVLEKSFVRVAEGLGMKTVVMVSDGDQPIGDGVGPLLEARDVVKVLRNHPKAPEDLREKALRMAAKLLVLVGRVDTEDEGYRLASKTLSTGKAWKKMKEIIAAQGGDPNVNIKKLKPSKISYDIKSQRKGVVSDIDNHVVARVCRILGAPETKEAGVLFYKKYGAKVRKGQVIATLYGASEAKLSMAKSYLKRHKMFDIR
ncbi:MAG TPA: thymidine phosphorylase, partial [Candidatus Aenigmarchaeota archaeon]|nr:thymidine phosphorylase [Candidatus Aenigmarchaeota archaeon]HEX32876.1 thymidine phosphorylase [Candidatus Aenigmarchaeota archaeon]